MKDGFQHQFDDYQIEFLKGVGVRVEVREDGRQVVFNDRADKYAEQLRNLKNSVFEFKDSVKEWLK